MPVFDDQYQPDLTQETLPAAIHSAEYKRSLLGKVDFLLENVADHHKVLIRSKIIGARREKFILDRIAEGDSYYREFLSMLNVVDLEMLLEAIKPGLELNSNNPKTAAAYNYVYHNKPIPTPKLLIEESYQAFGNVFSDSLREEAIRQHEEDVAKNPYLPLAEHEYKQCGKPLDLIFKFYLPKLGAGETQGRFNAVIRKVLKDPSLSTYEVQRRLRFTADRLADKYLQRDLVDDAYDLLESVFGRDYAAQRLDQYKNKMRSSFEQRASGWSKPFADYLRNLLGLKVKPKPKPKPGTNKPNYKPSAVVPTTSPALQELNSRFVKIEESMKKANELSLIREKTMAPAFAKHRQAATIELLPETHGPGFKRYRPA